MKTPMGKAEFLNIEVIYNSYINNLNKMKTILIFDEQRPIYEAEFTEVKVDNNGQVINPLNNGGKENED